MTPEAVAGVTRHRGDPALRAAGWVSPSEGASGALAPLLRITSAVLGGGEGGGRLGSCAARARRDVVGSAPRTPDVCGGCPWIGGRGPRRTPRRRRRSGWSGVGRPVYSNGSIVSPSVSWEAGMCGERLSLTAAQFRDRVMAAEHRASAVPERSDALAPYRRHRFMDAERMHEECGLFGVLAPGEDVANLTYFGLYALQHRGQESAGIAVSNHRELVMHKEMELVAQVFDAEAMAPLVGDIAIGHTRYSTTGSPRLPDAQPMRFEHGQLGPLALAHNGNLINAGEVREELAAAAGVEFVSTSDTEVLGRLLVRTPGATLDIVLHRALPRVHGAYCLLLLTRDSLVAARDPLGIRPLCLGRFGDGARPVESDTS